jgi:filamentous hemagglutinin family protein
MFEQSGNSTVITASDKAIINYSSFDIARPEIVEFVQPASTASVLNRILSENPTMIDGTLLANGRVFFVNPAGVFIGSGASINVNQLVASGLDISNDAFLSGQYQFAGGSGSVANYGDISAESVYLVGRQVANAGNIRCPGGYVVMAAGDRVFLGEPGTNVIVEIEPLEADQADVGDVVNEGTIDAAGGRIVLAAGDILAQAVTNAGTLSAAGGSVTMKAACVEQLGTISVDSALADAGAVSLSATEVAALGSGSLTTANAAGNGDGGEVIVQSEGVAVFDPGARIEAKGGSEAGDGGFVEISGEHLVFAGDVDTSAADGQMGTLLLDPTNIVIKNGDGANSAGNEDLDTVYEKQLEDQLSSIELFADEAITMEDLADNVLDLHDDGKSITLETGTDGSISFEDKSDWIKTTTGDIVMHAGSGGIDIGSLETGREGGPEHLPSGEIILATENGGDIATGSLKVAGGWGAASISAVASGDLEINGDVSVAKKGAAILNVPNQDDAQALIYLSAGENVTLNGDVGAYAHGKNPLREESETAADIRIFAGTNEGDNGDVTINGDLQAWAKSSRQGTSRATIEIGAWGDIYWGEDADAPLADADQGNAHVESYTSKKDESEGGDVAEIIINSGGNPGPRIPPVVFDDTYTMAQNEILQVPAEAGVLSNDTDEDGDSLTARFVQGPSHGTLTLNADGSFTYTPDQDYVGTDTFTYVATDGDGLFAIGRVTINVREGHGGNGEDLPTIPAAALPEMIVWEPAGCPALMNWLADELGVSRGELQRYVLHAYSEGQNAVGSKTGIGYKAALQFCQVCSKLMDAATILQDPDGARIAALQRVINEFASAAAPPSEEQMALIAAAFAEHTDDGTPYAAAGQWMDALAEYGSILTSEVGYSAEDSVAVVDKYLAPITEAGNPALTAFVQASLAGAIGG